MAQIFCLASLVTSLCMLMVTGVVIRLTGLPLDLASFGAVGGAFVSVLSLSAIDS